MQTFLLSLLCVLSVLTALSAVTGWRSWPLFLCASLVMLVVCVIEFYLSQRRAARPRSFDVDLRVNTVPSPQEIEEQIKRVQDLIRRAREYDAEPPQPPQEISVECFACHVTESYPAGTGNAAAQSPHLLTHPERCLVIGV